MGQIFKKKNSLFLPASGCLSRNIKRSRILDLFPGVRDDGSNCTDRLWGENIKEQEIGALPDSGRLFFCRCIADSTYMPVIRDGMKRGRIVTPLNSCMHLVSRNMKT